MMLEQIVERIVMKGSMILKEACEQVKGIRWMKMSIPVEPILRMSSSTSLTRPGKKNNMF